MAFAGINYWAVLVAAVAVSPLAMIPVARVTAAGAVFVQLTAAVSLLYARMRRAASRTERARLFYLRELQGKAARLKSAEEGGAAQ